MTKNDGGPAPMTEAMRMRREALCVYLRRNTLSLSEDAAQHPEPFTDSQALAVGLALQDLKALVESWRPK